MSDDTTVCSNCGASVPTGAKFCTTCGHATASESAAHDATNVEQPRPDSATQVLPPADPGAGSSAPPSWQPPPSSQPWTPSDTASSTPAAGSSAPPQPAPSWSQAPGADQPPTWQQPAAAPPYGQPPAGQAPGGQPAWGGQQPAWGQAPAPSSPSTSTKTSGSPLGGIVAIAGGVLTLVGIFTAWVGAKGGENLTGWDLTSGDKVLKSNDPYLLLVLAIVALAIGVVRFSGAMAPIAKVAAVVVGVVIIGVMIRDWLSIVDVVKDLPSNVKVEQKFGYFLTIGGGVIVAASALMPSAKKAS